MHNNISLAAGTFNYNCSFQLIVLPVLRLLTLPTIKNSVRRQFLLPLYTEISTKQFLSAIEQSLLKINETHEFRVEDPNDKYTFFWKPTSIEDVIVLVSDFLLRLLQLFQERATEDVFANCIRHLLDISDYVSTVTNSPDSLSCLETTRISVDFMMRITSGISKSRTVKAHTAVNMDLLHELVDDESGPGEIRLEGPRHNNDFADICRIQVVPTCEEITSRLKPWIPRNQSNSFHHLEYGTIERHLDTLFRLQVLRRYIFFSMKQRHDMVQPLVAGIHSLIFDNLPNILHTSGMWLADNFPSGSFMRAQNEEMGDICVYRQIQLEAISQVPSTGRSVGLEISFAQIPRIASRSAAERSSFWSRTKRLQSGSLVILWLCATDKVVPCTICPFKIADLEHGTRPKIMVSPCCDSDSFQLLVQEFFFPLEEREILLLHSNSGLACVTFFV